MSEDGIWSKDYQPGRLPQQAPPRTAMPPQDEREYEEAPQQQNQPRPPGKFKRFALGALGLVIGLTVRAIGLGMILLGHTLKFGQRLFQGRSESGSKKMSLKSVFLGAALVTGALMGPGAYYMTQPNDIVRTRVTGKVMADAKAEFPGQKYFIYTNQGKFDTYGVEGGDSIREGCVYDFNLKSARLQLWPPGYSRSIAGYKPVDGGCAP